MFLALIAVPMPKLLTKGYFWTRYWAAMSIIILSLAVSALIGWYGLQIYQSHSRYANAFIHLSEATNRFETEVAWSTTSAQAGKIDPGHNQALVDTYRDLVTVFTALNAIDEDSAAPETDEHKENEAEWSRIADNMGIGVAASQAKFGLSNGMMPQYLKKLWNVEKSVGGRDLEALVGELVTRGYSILHAKAPNESEFFQQAEAIKTLGSTKLHPALQGALALISESSHNNAVLIFYLLLASAAGALLIFSPIGRSIAAGQELLVRERDRALASQKAKRDFLAMMSHELRTPMNGILGFSNLMLSTDLNPQQRDYVETIQSSGETLLDLLNDILDISKIEAGSLELEREDFAIEEVVTNVVILLGPRALAKRLDLSAYIDPSLPEKLRGDAGRLRQIVINLVGNAIKFTVSGGVAIETKHDRVREDGNHDVMISVSDTGVGIPKDQLDRIFERFTQVDTSPSRKYEGAGLGLAICKELAKLMDGEIGVESTIDKGSTFWVRLKLDHIIPPAKKISEILNIDFQSRRILIIDDNALNRRIFKLQLEAFGGEVDCVPDARSALTTLSQAEALGRQYDVAIIDQMMPEIDGISLRNMIREQPQYADLRLIISSSGGVTSDQQARALGFDAACPKPVVQEKLIRKLHELLSERDQSLRLGAETSAPLTSAAVIEPPRSRKPRVLVAEDNAVNQRLILTTLKQAGYMVDIVADGVEAVHAAQRLPYDLILMDIRMPVMGGIEATRHIRSMSGPISRCPILAMTANAMVGDREEYLAAGMNDYVPKPIDLDMLIDKIRGYLGEPRSSGEDAAVARVSKAGAG